MSDLLSYNNGNNALQPGGNNNLLELYLLRFDRPSTRRAYTNDLRHFFGEDTITIDQVQHVNFIHVNTYISELEKRQFKPSTIKRKIAAIRGFFDWLIALGILQQNPAHKQLVRRIRSTDAKDRRIIFLSPDEARRLLEATRQSPRTHLRDRALISTMLHCVLRRSEAAGMDVEHLRPLGQYWILDIPQAKGGADQYVKVPEHVVESIEAMKSHYGITAGPLWRSLSNNNRGGRLTPDSIYQIIRKTATRAGLTAIGAHTLRHTGCTLAIDSGASLQQVQKHARHKNIETTMVYIHQRDRLQDSAADYIQLDDE